VSIALAIQLEVQIAPGLQLEDPLMPGEGRSLMVQNLPLRASRVIPLVCPPKSFNGHKIVI